MRITRNLKRLWLLGASFALVCCRVGYDEQTETQLNIQGAGETSTGATDAGASSAPSGGGSAQGGIVNSAGSTNGAGTSNAMGGIPSEAGAGEPGSAGVPESGGGSGGTGGSGGSTSAGSGGISGGGSGGTSGGGSGGTSGGGSGGTSGGGSGGTSGGGSGGTSGSGGTGGAGGCTAATYGGHDYLVCTTAKSFVSAAVDCATKGYRPVRIDSAGEQTFVHDQIPIADQNNNNTALWRWLGGDDQSVNGNWQWSDGTQFWTGGKGGSAVGGAYTNWNTNQPLSNQFCLAMEARAGTWYAMDCSTAKPYICEMY